MWIILVTYFCLKLVVPHSLYLFCSRFVMKKGLFMSVPTREFLIGRRKEARNTEISVVVTLVKNTDKQTQKDMS